jgi:hypothetical protein
LALTFFAKGVTLLTHQLHAIVIRRRHPLEPILLIADTKLLRLKTPLHISVCRFD